MTMTIIKPVDVQPNMLTSNVPIDDAPNWSTTTAYALGAKVIHNLRIWEAVAAVPAGTEPGRETITPANPAKWLDLGMVNRWRMFDDKVGTTTERAGDITVAIQPGQAISAVAFFNLSGSSITIRMVDPVAGEVYNTTRMLLDVGSANWYEYFFKPIGRVEDLTLLDLPSYPLATLHITLSAADTAKIGHVSIGVQDEIGVTLYGTSVGIIDYSRKETDQWGNTSIVERPFSKRAEFDIALDTSQVSRVQRLLASIRARPVVWIGSDIEATIIFGFFRDFNIVIANPAISDVTITVEGLV